MKLDTAGAGKLGHRAARRTPKGPSELYTEDELLRRPERRNPERCRASSCRPAALTVGIKVADWAVEQRPQPDRSRHSRHQRQTAGRPARSSVKGKRRIDYSHRRRIVGGFYAYEEQPGDTRHIGHVCTGKTDSRGLLLCEPKVASPEPIYLLAEARDGQGNIARAGTSYWVTGAGDLWFAAGNQDRIDVIPEKKGYAPGETARFQVRTPFREATALIVGRGPAASSKPSSSRCRASTRRWKCRSRPNGGRTSSSRCWRCAAASSR